MIRLSLALLPALLLLAQSSGQAQTVRVRSAHHIIIAPSGYDLGRLADHLEEAHRRLKSLGLPVPSSVTVRCHPSATSFQRATGRGRQFLAAAVRGELHLQPISSIGSRSDFPSVLLHEMTHVALERAARRGLPRWLNEGLAMTIAQEPRGDRGTFTSLVALDNTLASANATQSRPAYAAAQFLVGSLAERYSQARLIALCATVGRSGGFEKLFQALTGEAVETWGQRMLKAR